MWAPPDAKVSNTISNHQNNILLVCYLLCFFVFLKTIFCFSEIVNRCSDFPFAFLVEFSEKLDCGLFDKPHVICLKVDFEDIFLTLNIITPKSFIYTFCNNAQ